jgi:3,4-dihydroxy 2-butanone 4-phosphate synthase/GTP cyclohydrolase II
VHLALSRGRVGGDTPTLVRVHVSTTLRDLLACESDGVQGWSAQAALARIAAEGSGVLVLLARSETEGELLASIDLGLGLATPREAKPGDSYNTVGTGSQILRDLGVGKIRLMGAPIKYNAISGFGLEVVDYLEPDSAKDRESDGRSAND